MKKIKMIGAFALASCVMLSGCDNSKKEQPSPTPGPGPAPEAGIVVGELPDHVIVGQEYDLDQYVTVTNTESSFTITFSDDSLDLVTVDGHKVTPVGEGEISFTVSVDGKTATGSVSSIHKIRKDFMDVTSGLVDNYAGFHIVEGDDNMYYAGGYIAHAEKYTLDEQFFEDEDGYYPGGYIELDGKVYSYSLSAKETSPEEYVLVPEFYSFGDEPLDIEDVKSSFAIDASELVVKFGDETSYEGIFNKDALFLTATEANGEMLDKMFGGLVDASDYGYAFAGAIIEEFVEIEVEEGVTKQSYAVTPLYQGKTSGKVSYFANSMFGFVEKEKLEISVLDEVVEAGEAPTGKDFSEFNTVIDALVGAESYTVTTQYGGYLDDTPMSAAEAYSMQFPYGAYSSGTVNAYVTPTQIHIEEENHVDVSYGYIMKDDKVYHYGDYEANPSEPITIVVPEEDQEGKFPARVLYSFFSMLYETEVNMPELKSSYVPATEEDYPAFSIDSSELASYGILYVYAYATQQEYGTWLTALEQAGWSKISEDSEESPNDHMYRFGKTPATINVVDRSSEGDDFLDLSIALYGQMYDDYDGFYTATEMKGAASFADLQPYQNYSFLSSTAEFIDPETLDTFTLYDKLFVNYVSETSEEGVVTKSASFSGESGIYLLLSLGIYGAPECPDDYPQSVWLLWGGMNTIMYYDLHWDGEFTVSYSYSEENPEEILSFTISFRVDFGLVDLSEQGATEPDYHHVYWGFDTTFDLSHTKEIPSIDIHFPEAESEPESDPVPPPWEDNLD